MKKMKRIVSLLLATIMILAMGTSVFAEEPSYKITVTNTNSSISINGKEYSAYKLFDSTHSGDAYAYTMSTTSQFYNETLISGTNVEDNSLEKLLRTYFTFTAVSGDTSKVNVEPKLTFSTGENARAFADAIQKFLQNKTETAKATATGETATIDLTSAGEGYYIVTGNGAPKDPESTETVESAVIITSVNPTATVNPKAGIPTLDKKITGVKEGNTAINDAVLDNAGKAAVAKVGSTVSYELDSIVPDLTGYSDYTFTFEDSITAGLDYVKDSFDLKINNSPVSISPEIGTGDRSFTLTIPYTTLKEYAKGTAIVLTYKATVNADSLTYDYVKNTADLVYSNNPYSNSTNKTPKKETYVININLDVNKVATTEDGAKLKGAEFILYRIVNDKEEYYKWDTVNSVVTWGEKAEADTFTTGDNGALTQQIRGLDKGTYYLVETKAPTGYNLLKDPVAITISVSETDGKVIYKVAGTTLTNGTVDITKEQNENQPVATKTIINNTGAELPSTGGIGTTIFYVLGGILVIAAAILLVTKRRMNAKN